MKMFGYPKDQGENLSCSDDDSRYEYSRDFTPSKGFQSCIHDGICDTDGFDSDPEPADELTITHRTSSVKSTLMNSERSTYRSRKFESESRGKS